MSKNKKPSSSNPTPESVTPEPNPPTEPVTPQPPTGPVTPPDQKKKLYAVSHLLKENNMQLTEAPWCIGKTAMSQDDFDAGKDAWFNKDKKEETTSPDDGNTEENN